MTDFFTLRREGDAVVILDQTLLPHQVEYRRLQDLAQAAEAIRVMRVRGAPLIGATAAYGLALGLREDPSDAALAQAIQVLAATRPTAVNLHWALDRMGRALRPLPAAERGEAAWREAAAIAADDEHCNRAIGEQGLVLMREIAARRSPVRVMTHCNAGWLACVAHGTALAPVYAAQAAGIALRVYASETRPRSQGLLTAWELARAGVAHTLVADNACGHLIARGEVDLVIVGADRIAANGDTANKVGTYLKALACRDAGVPFYVAAPTSTIDWACASGERIPIEERGADEVLRVAGVDAQGKPATVRIAPAGTAVSNPAFDVTPARLIAGIVCERGVFAPGELSRARP